MMYRNFVLIIYVENKIGLLNRITGIFTRRHINIDSMTASESEIDGVYKFNVIINTTRTIAEKVSEQVTKQVEVIKVSLFEEQELVYQEIAMYKVPTKELLESDQIETLVRKHSARILYVDHDVMVIEKTGHKHETQLLLEELKPYGLLEFVRSGRVAVSKSTENIHSYIKEIETSQQLIAH